MNMYKSTKRNRLAILFLLMTAAWWAVGNICFAGQQPNVIVVLTDDQGYGEFSCHGNPIVSTPHIDKLAGESVRLTDFHVSPMCTPTRGQLMTGLDAFRNGAINVSSGRTLLKPDLKTMADVFKSAGYRTGLFGKWHLGDNYPFRPEDRGFEETLWFPSSHINSCPDFWDNDYFDDSYIHNGNKEIYKGYCTDVFFSEAMNWIDRDKSQSPFFAYIALNAAHWPWFVPENYRHPIRKSMKENPEAVKRLKKRKKENLVSFLAMGANIDDNVGRLDSFLDAHGLKDNTIVVFLTDNGSTMGQDYFNAGMRGKKTTLWEGGHRVPCFIRWPAGLDEPREVSELCHVQDLLPTLADLSGNQEFTPDVLDGIRLKELLTGRQATVGDRMLVINYSRMPGAKVSYTNENPAIPQRDGACVMWKHWRLLENRELYNVKEDPHQDHDVASDYPEVVARMRAHLDEWWSGVKDDVFEPQRVIIGHESENPALLSACEWLDVFVDQQIQIRRGVRKNGAWHVTVAQPGEYEFELRRWPKESGLKLTEGCPEINVTDGVFVEGEALPIHRTELRIGDKLIKLYSPNEDGTAYQCSAKLIEGETIIQTWFLDHNGAEICGAYYLYINRKSE
ncbi:arylsulfatase [Calycomorphotria hydatis]|uniref:Arylsulfatase n=1 Tax=Calycomorphotria hydatis TaxID=2528027 RepID=A0A517T631_9PLAN|nr:arylsulfatase [Calycomorphotria hydatis]QDT63824.1 Arylsulfatase [Calycomorphotria hydatis]